MEPHHKLNQQLSDDQNILYALKMREAQLSDTPFQKTRQTFRLSAIYMHENMMSLHLTEYILTLATTQDLSYYQCIYA